MDVLQRQRHGAPPQPGISGVVRFGWRIEYVLITMIYWSPPELLVELALPSAKTKTSGLWPLLAHLLILMLVLLPLAALETALGQRAQRGLLGCWGFSPIWRGLGHLLVVYNIIELCQLAALLSEMSRLLRYLIEVETSTLATKINYLNTSNSNIEGGLTSTTEQWGRAAQEAWSGKSNGLERGLALLVCILLTLALCPGPRYWGKPLSLLALFIPVSLVTLGAGAALRPGVLLRMQELVHGSNIMSGATGRPLSLLRRLTLAIRPMLTGGHLVLGSHRRLHHNPLPDLAIAAALSFLQFAVAFFAWHFLTNADTFIIKDQLKLLVVKDVGAKLNTPMLQDAPQLLLEAVGRMNSTTQPPRLLLLISGMMLLALLPLLAFVLRAAIIVRTFRDACSTSQCLRTTIVCTAGALLTLGCAAAVYFFPAPLGFLFTHSSFYYAPSVLATLQCIAVVHAYGTSRFLHSLRDIRLHCAAPGRFLLRAAIYVLPGCVTPLLLLGTASAGLWAYYAENLPGIPGLPNWAAMLLMASLFVALVSGLLMPIAAHVCRCGSDSNAGGACAELVEPASAWEVRPCAELGCSEYCWHARLVHQPSSTQNEQNVQTMTRIPISASTRDSYDQEQLSLHPLLRNYTDTLTPPSQPRYTMSSGVTVV